ncbi:restriction endonuclease [Methanosarcina hadiensis]|uniref:restriction endonuclease n=1 Tax=Methanosarcina hadiensis TaxID=3078083 RepID=UPI003977CCB3
MPLVWFKDPAKPGDELQIDKPIEKTVKKRKTISFWWFVIDILLLLYGHIASFLFLALWLVYRAIKNQLPDIKQQPSDQLSNVLALSTEYTLSKNQKIDEIPAYKAGYSNKAKEGHGWKLVDPESLNATRCTLVEIDTMDGYKFEKCIKHVFESLGYSVHHTQLSDDQGADLILTSNEGVKTAVQVKRYSNKVSNGAVQEVVAAKGLYKCTQGMVVTNSYFTDSAKELARANSIELIDRKGLEKLLNKISQNIFQDKEWLQHFHSSSLLLNTYYPAMITDLNLDYATLINFDQEIKRAIEENSLYSTSPKFLNARKEWGAALINFRAMKVHTISDDKDLTFEVITNLRTHLASGFGHLYRANEIVKYISISD